MSPASRFASGVRLFVLWSAAMGLVPPASDAEEIAVLISAEIAAYEQALAGLRDGLPRSATVTEYRLHGDVERGRSLARKIRASNAALAVAIGSKAALAAKLELVDIPVVFCMVLDPDRYDLTAPNITGILFEVPIDLQLGTMRSALPNLKRIGVAYDPENTAPVVEKALRLAKTLGLELVARPVSSGKDVPDTVRALLPSIDALWLIPDSTVLTEQSFRFILDIALEHTIPVIGFSSEFVRKGALLGLSVDYRDTGRQASQLVKKILAGQDFSAVPVVSPDRVRLALNLKTAKFLGITIPPDIEHRADTLY